MADIPAVAMAYRLAENQNALLKRVRQATAMRGNTAGHSQPDGFASGTNTLQGTDGRPGLAVGAAVRS